jgi:hypothetical protein
VQDRHFDKKLYIVSDCELFCQDLYLNKKLQNLILDLFNLEVKTIESDGKKLWVSFKNIPKAYKDKWWEYDKFEQYKAKILEILAAINQILNGLSSSHQPIDPLLSKWPKIKACLIIGFFAAFLNLCFDPYRDRLISGGLFRNSLNYSFSLFLISLIISTAIFFRTSRAHIILANNIKWVLPTAVIWVYFSMSYINVIFDNSPPEIFHSDVIEKKVIHGRHTTYEVIVKHFEQPGQTFILPSSKRLYPFVEAGSEITITVKGGYLGYRWVEKEENIVATFLENVNMEDAVKGIKPATIPASWLGKKLKYFKGYSWYDPKHPGDAIVFYQEDKSISTKPRIYARILKDGIRINKFGKKTQKFDSTLLERRYKDNL